MVTSFISRTTQISKQSAEQENKHQIQESQTTEFPFFLLDHNQTSKKISETPLLPS